MEVEATRAAAHMPSRFIAALAIALGTLAVSPSSVASDGEEFDRAAAANSLAAVSVQTCKRPKGPTGEGHLVITFAPSGVATLAQPDRAPYAKTKVGQCVAKEFRKVRVPPFHGPAITVGKNFKIE
jgi:hypothetical protein